ncbi:MAG: ATP-binding protein [Candidatus Pacearchaeota archaeon]|jgi:uncharacterized protein (TIGR00269 family)
MKIETIVKKTLKDIGLKKSDKILVALSGGKDSTIMAYFLKKFGFDIKGFHIDLGMGEYSEECLKKVKELCSDLGIELHLYGVKKEMGSSMCYLRGAIQSKHKKGQIKNCAICGVIKKWIMNREARKLKFDKIATGHNLDDEAQTYLLNILKGNLKLSFGTGAITQNVKNKKFIPRIKPLFYLAEKDIKKFSKEKRLPVNYEKCPCAIDSYRIQVRSFLENLPTKEKMNIVKNSQEVLGKRKKEKVKLQYCEKCGEPTMNKICKKCELVRFV